MGKFLIIPNNDCNNAGGEVMPNDAPVGGHAGCFVEPAAPRQPHGTP